MDRSNTTMGVYEFRTHVSEILERVSAGEEVTITRHGMPIARIVPPRRQATSEDIRAAFDKLRRRRSSLGKLSLKKLIREGRK